VGVGGTHGIARFPFTKAKVSRAFNRLRHHIDLARARPSAIGGHRSRRQTADLIYATNPASFMTPFRSGCA
jgi:hypothetical protein